VKTEVGRENVSVIVGFGVSRRVNQGGGCPLGCPFDVSHEESSYAYHQPPLLPCIHLPLPPPPLTFLHQHFTSGPSCIHTFFSPPHPTFFLHTPDNTVQLSQQTTAPPMQINTKQTNSPSTPRAVSGSSSTHERERERPPAGPGSPYTTTYTGTASFTMPQHSSFPPSPKTQSGPHVGGDKADAPGDAGKRDQKEQRLIVVSNRLPVTISKDDNGEYHFKVSSRSWCRTRFISVGDGSGHCEVSPATLPAACVACPSRGRKT